MQRIMTEPAHDLDGTVLGLSLSTSTARIDCRADGSFFMEACPILETSDLLELRALIEEALKRAMHGGNEG